MTIAPVVREVVVNRTPDLAFTLFVSGMGRWWPPDMRPGPGVSLDLVIEPYENGRWYETLSDGAQYDWGRVIDWAPPNRLVLGWALNASFKFDPLTESEVEITFEALDAERTRVRLEHRRLERLGAEAPRVADLIRGGWPKILEAFAALGAVSSSSESPHAL